MDNYNNLIRQHAEYKKIRDEQYALNSKDRLSKILKKKVTTTMIGALSSIEKHFGFLWEGDPDDLTEEHKVMHKIFLQVRQEILDKGNTQAKNIDAELAQYDVKWLKYQMNIPVTNLKKEDNKDE